LLAGIGKILELALEDVHCCGVWGLASPPHDLLDLWIRMGPERDAIRVIRIGNLDSASVSFDDDSPWQVRRFRVESDSFELSLSIAVAKSRHTVGFGTSLRIIFQ
jgi:hypothetical protein